jgi:hypothetical protein
MQLRNDMMCIGPVVSTLHAMIQGRSQDFPKGGVRLYRKISKGGGSMGVRAKNFQKKKREKGEKRRKNIVFLLI